MVVVVVVVGVGGQAQAEGQVSVRPPCGGPALPWASLGDSMLGPRTGPVLPGSRRGLGAWAGRADRRPEWWRGREEAC